MKKFAALMSIIIAVTFSAGMVIGADAPAKITIKHIQNKKPPVVFDHKGHQERAKNCQECHHKSEKGKEEKCFSCHEAKKKGDAVAFKEAMHKTCKDCHKKDASKKAPVKCDGCHKK